MRRELLRYSGICAAIAVVCLSGCHGWSRNASDIVYGLNGVPSPQRVDQAMRSWQDHPISDVISNWGPPSQTIPVGSGDSIFVWRLDRTRVHRAECESESSATSGTVRANGQVQIDPGKVTTTCSPAKRTGYVAYRMFYVNNSGVIYKWGWKGL